MAKYKITRKLISRIIKETLIKLSILSEGYDETPDYGRLVSLNTPELYNKYVDEVWKMLSYSYDNIGGLKSYRDYRDFLKKKHQIDVVVDKYDRLTACATYRNFNGGLKMVAIGCNQTQEGKLSLQEIIKHNIKNVHLNYWCEASGKIEYFFKKHNGYPIPNIFAEEILNLKNGEIRLSKYDNVHYERPIGKDGEYFEKMIFGFCNEALYEKVLEDVEDYYGFREYVNNQNNFLTENFASEDNFTVKDATYIIERIYMANEEDGLIELTPSMNKLLEFSVSYLKQLKEKNNNIIQYIEFGSYLLENTHIIAINRMPEINTETVFFFNGNKTAL